MLRKPIFLGSFWIPAHVDTPVHCHRSSVLFTLEPRSGYLDSWQTFTDVIQLENRIKYDSVSHHTLLRVTKGPYTYHVSPFLGHLN